MIAVESKPEQPNISSVLIRNATIVDGSGSPPFRGNVLVVGDRITQVGRVESAAATEIDAAGLVVAPGFIDAHAHDDRAVLSTPDMAAKVSQGVTTVIVGHCGISLAPHLGNAAPPPLDVLGPPEVYEFETFGAYLQRLRASPPAVNVAPLVGHGTLRVSCVADLNKPATDEEFVRMREMLREAMSSGAIGMSSGLYYPPFAAATSEEVAQLAKEVATFNGVYTSHLRDEGIGIMAALEEAFDIARHAEIALVISHHKCAHRAMWGRSTETLALIDRESACREVSLDVYPYDASSTVLLADAAEAARSVIVTWSATMPAAAGRDLDEIAAELGLDRRGAIERLNPGGATYFRMLEEDVRRILAHPRSMVGSDGLPDDEHPHPRLWGTFPRVLARYVRDARVLSLAEAVRKMTDLPAQVFGLRQRGRVAPGYYADLVLFDPERIQDTATYEDPCHACEGIELVMVNGQTVWRHGRPSGLRPGHLLTRAPAT